MNKYVTHSINGENFTQGKHYKIEYEYTNDRVLVCDDRGERVIVRVDGQLSARLGWKGKFTRCSDLLAHALGIACDAENLVKSVKPEVEAQRRVEEALKSAVKPGGVIYNAGIRGGFISRHVLVNADSTPERLRKAEHEAAQHKAELLKAEAVIDQLYDLFPHTHNHEQLIAAIKSAKIFSDAFLELQKIK